MSNAAVVACSALKRIYRERLSTAGNAVTFVHLDGDRAFVRGALPEGARIVAHGPHRVADGQRIAPES